MITILIADDEENIRNLYKIRLTKRGFRVLTARDGKEALDLLYKGGIDIVILDVMMPTYSGFEVLDTIRSDGLTLPVILATAKGELSDKREGFTSGADDYIVKPFEFEELLLRIDALVRRFRMVSEEKLVIGSVTLDAESLVIYDDHHRVTLSKREFSILYKLLSYPEKSFTKEQIFDEFFGIDSDADYDSIKVYISKIRKQISVFPEIDIDTIRGVGYRGVKRHE